MRTCVGYGLVSKQSDGESHHIRAVMLFESLQLDPLGTITVLIRCDLSSNTSCVGPIICTYALSDFRLHTAVSKRDFVVL